jgi:hypothetical protein
VTEVRVDRVARHWGVQLAKAEVRVCVKVKPEVRSAVKVEAKGGVF